MNATDYHEITYDVECKIIFRQKAKEVYFPFGIKGYCSVWKNTKLLFLEEINIHHLADRKFVQYICNSIQNLEMTMEE
ncbi:MAG: hypothetical protein JXN65_11950 [Clostridia bacterium]|nr:hypothetical protein [Clostridia bacterium]